MILAMEQSVNRRQEYSNNFLNSPYAERPEGVAVAPWRHFLEKPCEVVQTFGIRNGA